MSDKELRELEIWLAEHLFGYKWYRFEAGGKHWFTQTHPSAWVQRQGGIEAPPEGTEMNSDAPRYTTDPAAAMEVLKKCAEEQTVTVEHSDKNQLGQPQWLVALLGEHDGDYVEEFCKCAPTLELAICLFAKQVFHKP